MNEEQQRAYLNWSSGKDASLALFVARKDPSLKIERLFTTINAENQRVSMHGVHRELLEAQAQSIGLPIDICELPEQLDLERYNARMEEKVKQYKASVFDHAVFGDLFLADLKNYREVQLEKAGIQAHFPLWKSDTKELLETFIARGFKAVIVAVNEHFLDASFCGREVDTSFLADLPHDVDPCGENGEFHTFCYDGPIFNYPVQFQRTSTVRKTYPAPQGSSIDVSEYSFRFQDLKLS
ncbi:MAG: diphthine--ammonia ligase [Bacteroidota bacterium]